MASQYSLAPVYNYEGYGIEAKISEIAGFIKDKCQWIENVYGRAYMMEEIRDKKKVVFPKVYDGQGGYINVFANDCKKSSLYFILDGPEQPIEQSGINTGSFWKAKVSVFCFYNIKSKADEIGSSPAAGKNSLIKAFSSVPSATILKIQDEGPGIFKEIKGGNRPYNLGTFDNLTTYPYKTIRIEIEVNYADYSC